MVHEVVRAVGKGEITHVPFPASREKIDIKRFVVSTEKIRQKLGWQPTVSLRRGVEMTVAFYRDRLGEYLRES
jgi:nucleoside-diphosphate-sugar epimerase